MKELTTRCATIFIFALILISHAHAGGVTGGNANSDWQIYGWQNWSYEFVEVGGENSDGRRS